jgi:ribulose kinase
MRADLTGRPADVLSDTDASAIGAGLIAAVAAGTFPDIATASAALALATREVFPRPSPAYETAYRLYRDRFAALEPTWR